MYEIINNNDAYFSIEEIYSINDCFTIFVILSFNI